MPALTDRAALRPVPTPGSGPTTGPQRRNHRHRPSAPTLQGRCEPSSAPLSRSASQPQPGSRQRQTESREDSSTADSASSSTAAPTAQRAAQRPAPQQHSRTTEHRSGKRTGIGRKLTTFSATAGARWRPVPGYPRPSRADYRQRATPRFLAGDLSRRQRVSPDPHARYTWFLALRSGIGSLVLPETRLLAAPSRCFLSETALWAVSSRRAR